jgi:hypothetical protein
MSMRNPMFAPRSRLFLAGFLASSVLPAGATLDRTVAAETRWCRMVDSARDHRDAEDAQARFESVRLHNLPFAPSSTGPCNAKVGRFCHYNDERREVPPLEPERIGRERDSLIVLLSETARRLPGDGWVSGHLVRYLLEDQRFEEATRASDACRASAWWCAALRGLVRHMDARYEVADSFFTVMLHQMPTEKRCEWNDLSRIMTDGLESSYSRLSCAERPRFEDRFWWLADPLYSTPGNERRTEHFARHTMSEIELSGRTTHDIAGVGARNDLRELSIRYGFPRFYTRDATHQPPPGNYIITGHEPSPAYRFTPLTKSTEELFDLTAVEWEFRDDRAVERYALEKMPTMLDLEAMLSAFRRGDSTLLVAGYTIDDMRFPSDSTHAAVALVANEQIRPTVQWTLHMKPRGTVMVTAPGLAHLASVETFSVENRAVGRHRRFVRAPALEAGAVTISDVLLYDPPGDSLLETLDEVLPYARHSSEVRANAKLGLYFELYGLPSAGTSVPISLTLSQRKGGALRKLAERLGLAKPISPLSMRWKEVPRTPDVVSARTLAVDLSLTPPGRYVLEVKVSPEGGKPAATQRAIEITK